MSDVRHGGRRSVRLPKFNYAEPAAYFVTLCAQGRGHLFGSVVGDRTVPGVAGHMLEHWLLELGKKFRHVRVGAAVVMPNHLHALLHFSDDIERIHSYTDVLSGALIDVEGRGGPECPPPVSGGPGASPGGAHPSSPTGFGGTSAGAPLPRVVQWFKTMTTNAYIHGVKENGWTVFNGRLWQRNYYEHVVRDKFDLARIQEYIAANPARWLLDRENPDRTGEDEFDQWLDSIHDRPSAGG